MRGTAYRMGMRHAGTLEIPAYGYLSRTHSELTGNDAHSLVSNRTSNL